MLPVVSLSAVQFGYILGGSIIVETIFLLEGIGSLAWEAIQQRDLPLIQAIMFILGLCYLFLTLISDILNAWLDPQVRVA